MSSAVDFFPSPLFRKRLVDDLIFIYAANSLFDASRYEFFGQNVVGEVELGGLEEDEDVPLFGSTDEEYRLFVQEEVSFSSQLRFLNATFVPYERKSTSELFIYIYMFLCVCMCVDKKREMSEK